jgi:hypothetical protein
LPSPLFPFIAIKQFVIIVNCRLKYGGHICGQNHSCQEKQSLSGECCWGTQAKRTDKAGENADCSEGEGDPVLGGKTSKIFVLISISNAHHINNVAMFKVTDRLHFVVAMGSGLPLSLLQLLVGDSNS